MNEQETKITKSLKGKAPYILNLSDGMTAVILQNSRERIALLNASLEAMMPTWEKEKVFYEEAKAAFDAVNQQRVNLEEEIAKQQAILDTVGKFADRPAKARELRVNVPLDTEPASKTAPNQIAWLTEAADVLAKEQRFMSPDELLNKILDKDHVKEALKLLKTGGNITSLKAHRRDSLMAHAKKVSMGVTGRNLKPTLVVYRDLIGLIDFAEIGEGGRYVPKKEYLKVFMFAG